MRIPLHTCDLLIQTVRSGVPSEPPVLDRSSGYQISEARCFTSGNLFRSRYPQELKNICRKTHELKGASPSILIVILPVSAAPQRKAVKQFGDINYGVITQCVVCFKVLRWMVILRKVFSDRTRC